jgi:tetratricopeptide (TPR) repeat protein
LGQVHLSLADLRRARECLQSSVQSLAGDKNRERFGQPLLPSISSRLWLVHVLVELGEFAEAIARGEEATDIAEAVDHPPSLIAAYRGLGYLYLRKGDLDRAIGYLERCSELCRVWAISVTTTAAAAYMGYAFVLSGRLADGLSFLERVSIEVASRQDMTGYVVTLANLSEAYALANREEEALRLVNQAIDFARDHKRRHQEAWALRTLGRIAAHHDPPDMETAKASYRQAMAIADELGMRPVAADCHLGLGKLYGRVADTRRDACEHLTTAATMYRAMDMRFWLEKAEAELESCRL